MVVITKRHGYMLLKNHFSYRKILKRNSPIQNNNETLQSFIIKDCVRNYNKSHIKNSNLIFLVEWRYCDTVCVWLF